ncbi:MAG: hypothetical protein BMS9Abin25_1257 [Gammaproteobacteria bacterium]|nr:MAG: hypothetical protein BMS9Abin25_1257 [Gammaproteobacteria bacterium]
MSHAPVAQGKSISNAMVELPEAGQLKGSESNMFDSDPFN